MHDRMSGWTQDGRRTSLPRCDWADGSSRRFLPHDQVNAPSSTFSPTADLTIEAHSPADGVRRDASRSFVVQHWEFDKDRLDGFDYDEGAEQMAVIQPADEAELVMAIACFGLTPNSFEYPWDTDDPR